MAKLFDRRSITSRQNGKLGGGPKKAETVTVQALQEMLRRHAFEEIERTYGTKTVRQARILHLYETLYENGTVRKQTDAIERYMNRTLGMPKQSTDITSNGGTIMIDL